MIRSHCVRLCVANIRGDEEGFVVFGKRENYEKEKENRERKVELPKLKKICAAEPPQP